MFRGAVLVGRWLGVAALAILTSIVAAETILRSLFGTSMEFVEELSGILLVAITFLAAADSFFSGRFMRVDVLNSNLPAARGCMLDRLLATLAGFFCAGLSFYAAGIIWSSFKNGVVITGLGGLPVWIPQTALFVGACLLTIACFRRAATPGDVSEEIVATNEFE